jgi:hypothetical protein
LGLAGPGAGHDQQRTVVVRDRSELLSIETAEQRVQPAGDVTGSHRRVHDRNELAPGGDLFEGTWFASSANLRVCAGGGHAANVVDRRDT